MTPRQHPPQHRQWQQRGCHLCHRLQWGCALCHVQAAVRLEEDEAYMRVFNRPPVLQSKIAGE